MRRPSRQRRNKQKGSGKSKRLSETERVTLGVLNSRRSLISPRACRALIDGCRKPGLDPTSSISETTWWIFVKLRTAINLYKTRLEATRQGLSGRYEHGRYLVRLLEAPGELSERRELSTPTRVFSQLVQNRRHARSPPMRSPDQQF